MTLGGVERDVPEGQLADEARARGAVEVGAADSTASLPPGVMPAGEMQHTLSGRQAVAARVLHVLPTAGAALGSGGGNPWMRPVGGAVGGAVGRAAELVGRHAVGLPTPSDPIAAAKDIGAEGLKQGGYGVLGELGGAAVGKVGSKLIKSAIEPTAELVKKFRNVDIPAVAARERIPVTSKDAKVLGSEMGTLKIKKATDALFDMLRANAGTQIATRDIAAPVRASLQRTNQVSNLPDATREKMLDMLIEFTNQHPQFVSPENAEWIRLNGKNASASIESAIKAGGKSAVGKASVRSQVERGLARGAKNQLTDKLPEYAGMKTTQRELIALKEALAAAEAAAPPAAMRTPNVLGAQLSVPRMSRARMSRLGMAATHPAVREAVRALPRGLGLVGDELQDQR